MAGRDPIRANFATPKLRRATPRLPSRARGSLGLVSLLVSSVKQIPRIKKQQNIPTTTSSGEPWNITDLRCASRVGLAAPGVPDGCDPKRCRMFLGPSAREASFTLGEG